jgi:hypothetical protein
MEVSDRGAYQAELAILVLYWTVVCDKFVVWMPASNNPSFGDV